MVKINQLSHSVTLVAVHSLMLVLVLRLSDLIHSQIQEHSPLLVNQLSRLILDCLVVVKSLDLVVLQNLQQLMLQKTQFSLLHLDLEILQDLEILSDQEQNLSRVRQKKIVQEQLQERVLSSQHLDLRKHSHSVRAKVQFYSTLQAEKEMRSLDLRSLKVLLPSVILLMNLSQELSRAKVLYSRSMVLQNL